MLTTIVVNPNDVHLHFITCTPSIVSPSYNDENPRKSFPAVTRRHSAKARRRHQSVFSSEHQKYYGNGMIFRPS
jgi:hypothetical protein